MGVGEVAKGESEEGRKGVEPGQVRREKWTDRPSQPGRLAALSNSALCWPNSGKHPLGRDPGQVGDGYKQDHPRRELCSPGFSQWGLGGCIGVLRQTGGKWAPKAQGSVRGFLSPEVGLLTPGLPVTVYL